MHTGVKNTLAPPACGAPITTHAQLAEAAACPTRQCTR
jgi:hypothetical protein